MIATEEKTNNIYETIGFFVAHIDSLFQDSPNEYMSHFIHIVPEKHLHIFDILLYSTLDPTKEEKICTIEWSSTDQTLHMSIQPTYMERLMPVIKKLI